MRNKTSQSLKRAVVMIAEGACFWQTLVIAQSWLYMIISDTVRLAKQVA